MVYYFVRKEITLLHNSRSTAAQRVSDGLEDNEEDVPFLVDS